jgi:hypothetical protein
MILFPQLKRRGMHGNIDSGNVLWEQNSGLQGLLSARRHRFPQTNVCESLQKPAGRPLSELALRLIDRQPDSFTTEDATTVTPERTATGRRWSVFLIRPM